METKTIYVIVSYRAEVPVDADLNEINDQFEDKIEDILRCSLETESDDPDMQEPLFERSDVNVCESYQLSMK